MSSGLCRHLERHQGRHIVHQHHLPLGQVSIAIGIEYPEGLAGQLEGSQGVASGRGVAYALVLVGDLPAPPLGGQLDGFQAFVLQAFELLGDLREF